MIACFTRPFSFVNIPGPYVYADVLDSKHLHSIVVNNDIDWVVHFSALLSAIGEDNPRRALDVSIHTSSSLSLPLSLFNIS